METTGKGKKNTKFAPTQPDIAHALASQLNADLGPVKMKYFSFVDAQRNTAES